MNSNLTALPDALRRALGQVIATERQEWKRDREVIVAETRQLVRDAQASAAILEAKFGQLDASLRQTVTERLTLLKDGKDGRDGADGKEGEKGLPGASGALGAPGPAGERGVDGRDGRDGKDGRDGEAGETGEKGDSGQPGPAGESGRDADDVHVPQEMAELMAQGLRMLAETPEIRVVEERSPVNINMPESKIPEIKMPESIINVHVPEAKPIVNFMPAAARKTRTVVTKHDNKGRILEFEREEF